MTRRVTRRTFLVGGGLTTMATLSGCTTVRSTVNEFAQDLPVIGASVGAKTVGGQLPNSMNQEGTFDVIIPGDDTENILNHYYRSSEGPLRMESNVGGIGLASPQDNGILMSVDLTHDDVYGAAGFTLGPVDIADIEAIRFESTNDFVVGLLLGIAFKDGTIGGWEPVDGARERRTGFEGDDRALTEYISDTESPLTRTHGRFGSPPNGGAGSLSDVTIEDIQAKFGNIPVRVAASIDGGPGDSRRTVVERLEVALQG